MLNFKVQYLYQDLPKITLPREGDVGIDIYSNKDIEIPYQCAKLVPTGILIEPPTGYWIQIQDRSSMSKYCHTLAGIIDETYRGEILINMYCHTPRDGNIEYGTSSSPIFGFQIDKRCYKINRGDKIAQLIIRKSYNREAMITEVYSLTATNRGASGFGSTGE
jgi:dUTP pyrophosphatase